MDTTMKIQHGLDYIRRIQDQLNNDDLTNDRRNDLRRALNDAQKDVEKLRFQQAIENQKKSVGIEITFLKLSIYIISEFYIHYIIL